MNLCIAMWVPTGPKALMSKAVVWIRVKAFPAYKGVFTRIENPLREEVFSVCRR
jgi:hypothetical protein